MNTDGVQTLNLNVVANYSEHGDDLAAVLYKQYTIALPLVSITKEGLEILSISPLQSENLENFDFTPLSIVNTSVNTSNKFNAAIVYKYRTVIPPQLMPQFLDTLGLVSVHVDSHKTAYLRYDDTITAATSVFSKTGSCHFSFLVEIFKISTNKGTLGDPKTLKTLQAIRDIPKSMEELLNIVQKANNEVNSQLSISNLGTLKCSIEFPYQAPNMVKIDLDWSQVQESAFDSGVIIRLSTTLTAIGFPATINIKELSSITVDVNKLLPSKQKAANPPPPQPQIKKTTNKNELTNPKEEQEKNCCIS